MQDTSLFCTWFIILWPQMRRLALRWAGCCTWSLYANCAALVLCWSFHRLRRPPPITNTSTNTHRASLHRCKMQVNLRDSEDSTQNDIHHWLMLWCPPCFDNAHWITMTMVNQGHLSVALINLRNLYLKLRFVDFQVALHLKKCTSASENDPFTSMILQAQHGCS